MVFAHDYNIAGVLERKNGVSCTNEELLYNFSNCIYLFVCVWQWGPVP